MAHKKDQIISETHVHYASNRAVFWILQWKVWPGVPADPQRDRPGVCREVLSSPDLQGEVRSPQGDWTDELSPSSKTGPVSCCLWHTLRVDHGDGVVSNCEFKKTLIQVLLVPCSIKTVLVKWYLKSVLFVPKFRCQSIRSLHDYTCIVKHFNSMVWINTSSQRKP